MPKMITTRDEAILTDRAHRSIVIYGAGSACGSLLRALAESQLLDLSAVTCIIDGNPKKQGTSYEFDDRRIPICTPDVLRSLDPSTHLVIISSRKFANGILEVIRQIIPSSPLPIISDFTPVFRSRYNTAEELLSSDQLALESLRRSGWSSSSQTILDSFRTAFEKAHGNKAASCFSPITGGANSLLFGYTVDGKEYVFRALKNYYPLGHIYSRNNPELHARFLETQSKVESKSDLFIYQDEAGNRIERYATSLAPEELTSDHFVPEALSVLRTLHSIEVDLPFNTCYLKTLYDDYYWKLIDLYSDSLEGLSELDSVAPRMLSEYLSLSVPHCLCHGDARVGNYVRYNGKLMLIDWDNMTVDNPLIDVCLFLFSLTFNEWWPEENSYEEVARRLYGSLDAILECYYGRPATQQEQRQALLVLKNIEILCLMEDCMRKGRFDKSRLGAIIDSISCSNCMYPHTLR